MAGYVAGVLQATAARPALTVALNDPVPAVRWNAAVALGLMRDPAAAELLGRMIDRDFIATVPGVGAGDMSPTMLAALAAIRALGPERYVRQLIQLRDTDPDLRVREAARQALAVADGSASSNSGLLLAPQH